MLSSKCKEPCISHQRGLVRANCIWQKKESHPWESKYARTIIDRAYYLCSKKMHGLEPSLRILHQFLQKQTWPNKERSMRLKHSIKLKHWITVYPNMLNQHQTISLHQIILKTSKVFINPLLSWNLLGFIYKNIWTIFPYEGKTQRA